MAKEVLVDEPVEMSIEEFMKLRRDLTDIITFVIEPAHLANMKASMQIYKSLSKIAKELKARQDKWKKENTIDIENSFPTVDKMIEYLHRECDQRKLTGGPEECKKGNRPDLHTCHADCPCHQGKEPIPDFGT